MKVISMSAPLETYLRTYRKRSGLSQDEVAFLLGSGSGAKVSRYEHSARRPGLQTLFAYEVIFQVRARELFLGIYQKVERETRRRALRLAGRLTSAEADRMAQRKLAALRTLFRDTTGADQNP